MGLEYELKYIADEETLASIARVLPEPTGEFDMQTTYYDTPEGALSRVNFTLRRRLENDRSVCTLKTPAKKGSRGEWELECDSLEIAIEELCKLGAPVELLALTAGGVVPVCGARFHRTTWDLFIQDAYIELALDKGVVTGGGKEEAFCEVEVELKEGDKSLCDAFGADLANACGLKTQTRSKFRRAKDLLER